MRKGLIDEKQRAKPTLSSAGATHAGSGELARNESESERESLRLLGVLISSGLYP